MAKAATYIALLRGINVGGQTRIAMADLRRLMEDLGHTNVVTYVQSGNAVFRTSKAKTGLAGALEQAIAKQLGVSCSVLLRTAKEMERIVAANPFLSNSGDSVDVKQLHVTFLDQSPSAKKVKALSPPAGETGRFTVTGKEVYLYTPDGYGRSKLGNTFFEKGLGVTATNRNWRTVTTLRDMSGSLTA